MKRTYEGAALKQLLWDVVEQRAASAKKANEFSSSYARALPNMRGLNAIMERGELPMNFRPGRGVRFSGDDDTPVTDPKLQFANDPVASRLQGFIDEYITQNKGGSKTCDALYNLRDAITRREMDQKTYESLADGSHRAIWKAYSELESH